jgi:hypothetical protein
MRKGHLVLGLLPVSRTPCLGVKVKPEVWPAAGFTDTLFRCEGEAGGAPCSVASSDVSSRSRRFD